MPWVTVFPQINEKSTVYVSFLFQHLLEKIYLADIFDSKFGGMPYWNIDKEYPADENGNKLMLLAQINFDKAPKTVEQITEMRR